MTESDSMEWKEQTNELTQFKFIRHVNIDSYAAGSSRILYRETCVCVYATAFGKQISVQLYFLVIIVRP